MSNATGSPERWTVLSRFQENCRRVTVERRFSRSEFSIITRGLVTLVTIVSKAESFPIGRKVTAVSSTFPTETSCGELTSASESCE
jgi:hypothetical protein